MPLYDCMLLLKPHIKKEAVVDLVTRVGKHVHSRNGVLTDIKSLGNVQLGYGVKKLDGKYYQGQLMQMTMMATPNMNKELHYLNKEDRLLRWLLVKHRDKIEWPELQSEEESRKELYNMLRRPFPEKDLSCSSSEEDDDDDDDDEYINNMEYKKA